MDIVIIVDMGIYSLVSIMKGGKEDMTEKRFIADGIMVRDIEEKIPTILTHNEEQLNEFLSGLNALHEENEQLKSEINMLKNTIGRNEAFIKRITSNGEWNNTSMKQGDWMTEKRFNRVGGYVYDKDKCISHFEDVKHRDEIIDLLNELHEENEELKQQRKELIRLIDNNIEIYENINTNVEFHQGEIQGKLVLLNNLREVI